MDKIQLPFEVIEVLKKLDINNFEAYLVGGCVRDMLKQTTPSDWDITSNATPEQVQKVFPDNFCNNDFGTVTVSGIEITPFRTEERYSDKRHPDEVKWAKTLKEDLSRRDFTINAMAMKLDLDVIDLFKGKKDLKDKIIRTVGKPEDRFKEDALRMMRAVRFAVVLNFSLEKKTKEAIQKNAAWVKVISKERIRDELMKIISSPRAAEGIELLREVKLLAYIIPELEENYGVAQNKHHLYNCYEHAVRSLDFAAKKEFNNYVRMAALLHDIGKPKTKKGEGEKATFYNHEIVGAKIAEKILKRLRFSKKDLEKIVKLVRYHLFYYNVDEVTESSVRRLARKVGLDSIDELLQLRMADRIGSGCPKAEPYKLRHLRYVIEKVSKDPISVKKLEVSGEDIMKVLEIKPGPQIGMILDILLDYVLNDPKKNTKKFLEEEIRKLGKLDSKKLISLARKARKEREEIETKQDEMTKKKYWVT